MTVLIYVSLLIIAIVRDYVCDVNYNEYITLYEGV